jgi:hypothetical protein
MFFHASEVRKYMIHPLKSIKIPFPGVFFTSERLAASLEQLNQPDQHRRCPLHMAAFFGKAEAVPRRNPFFWGERLGNPWDGMGISPYTI